MTEYITKEQALEAIKGKMWPGELETAIKVISPTDVAPVVHGEWLNGKTFLENAVCSNCKTTYEAYYSKYQYCPQCGAKMDGGERK